MKQKKYTQQSLKVYKKERIKIAHHLHYPAEIIDKIRSAKNEIQVDQAMATGRQRMKDR